jgi:hypothetical protein
MHSTFLFFIFLVCGMLGPLIRVNPGSIFRWGLIFIFGGVVNSFFSFYFKNGAFGPFLSQGNSI